MSDVTRILDRVQQGDPNAAEALLPLVYEELRRLVGESAFGLNFLGVAYVRAGRTNDAQKILPRLLDLQRQGLDYRVYTATVQNAPGYEEDALKSLEMALAERASELEILSYDSDAYWGDLRSHPRVQAILKKMNLVPESGTGSTATSRQKTLAGLPFVNQSADKADEYLSDGITDELINTLQSVSGLQVQRRASSFYFKGRNESHPRIGEQLRVTYLVEGSVTKSGNQLRVIADLVRAADGFHLWGAKYNREMADILDIRSDVAQQVVTALKVQLGVGEAERIVKEPTENPEAYALCLQGRLWSHQGTSEGFTNALRLFQQAIALDPGYALAYAEAASAYVLVSDWLLPPRKAMAEAKTNVEQALLLDGTLAQAHVALGEVKDYYEWDHEEAGQEFARALALAPNSERALRGQGWHQIRMKRFEEARRALRRAWELDPFSHPPQGWTASMTSGTQQRKFAAPLPPLPDRPGHPGKGLSFLN